MTNLPTRLLALSLVVAGTTFAGCNNNHQYENQTDDVGNPPTAPIDEPTPAPTPMDQDNGMNDGMNNGVGMNDMNHDQALALGEVMAAPTDWVGKTVSGTATVTEVPSDRGFWVEANGQKIFAILNDGPQEVPVDINAGQKLKIATATVRDPSFLPQVPGAASGEPLDDETRNLAQGQQVYLVVDEDDIQIQNDGLMPDRNDQMDQGTTPGDGPDMDDLNDDGQEPDPTEPPRPM
ncbi:MAG: hypothetical protein R3F59_30850 [Myxococcota bacterium]